MILVDDSISDLYPPQGANSYSKTFNNLNNMDNLTREKEILSMCWSDDATQEHVS